MDKEIREISLLGDLGFDFVHRVTGENRASALRYAFSRAHHRVGLRPAGRDEEDRARRALLELAVNAIQHVPRRSVTPPWSFTLRRDGDWAVWTIADEGPGLLGRYREAWRYEEVVAHYGTEDRVLDALIHERLTSFPGDPNAGLGLTIALREVSRLGGELKLHTDGRSLSLSEGRMERSGDDDRPGTTWIATLQMRAREDA